MKYRRQHQNGGSQHHHLGKGMLSTVCLTVALATMLVLWQNRQFNTRKSIPQRSFSSSWKPDAVVTNREERTSPPKEGIQTGTPPEVTLGSQTQETSFRDNAESHQMRRRIGQAGLDSVRTAFTTTTLTTLETVLSQGFPHRWNPCTLERIYQSKEPKQHAFPTPLRITLLGGSGSARSSDPCSSSSTDRDDYVPRDVYGGRYSNILEHSLNSIGTQNSSFWKVEITNMGQGGMYEGYAAGSRELTHSCWR